MLSVERRITHTHDQVKATRDQVKALGLLITARKDERRRWEPRDYMMAGAGMAMVIAALSEKTGWTSVIVGLSKLYGGR
jgi:hypothetical protein